MKKFKIEFCCKANELKPTALKESVHESSRYDRVYLSPFAAKIAVLMNVVQVYIEVDECDEYREPYAYELYNGIVGCLAEMLEQKASSVDEFEKASLESFSVNSAQSFWQVLCIGPITAKFSNRQKEWRLSLPGDVTIKAKPRKG